MYAFILILLIVSCLFGCDSSLELCVALGTSVGFVYLSYLRYIRVIQGQEFLQFNQ